MAGASGRQERPKRILKINTKRLDKCNTIYYNISKEAQSGHAGGGHHRPQAMAVKSGADNLNRRVQMDFIKCKTKDDVKQTMYAMSKYDKEELIKALELVENKIGLTAHAKYILNALQRRDW